MKVRSGPELGRLTPHPAQGPECALGLVGAEGTVERVAHGKGGGSWALTWAPGEDCVLDVSRMRLAEPWTGGCRGKKTGNSVPVT